MAEDQKQSAPRTSLAANQGPADATPNQQSAPAPLPAINLTKGRGAIRGIGEKFAANPVARTGSFTRSAVRCGTSIGPNHREVQAGETRNMRSALEATMGCTFGENLTLLLEQLPGIWGCKNKDSIFLYANKEFRKIAGIDVCFDIVGRSDFEVPCDVARCAHLFRAQDAEVMRSERSMKILDIHPFAGGEWKAMTVTKTPLYDDHRNVVGTIFHGTDVTSLHTIELGFLLGRTAENMTGESANQQVSCRIEDYRDTDLLTKRESEVLFFLVYGKGAKEIAGLLSLSHRTVERHIDNLKNKFGARGKSELIEVAILGGHVRRIPQSLFSRQLSLVLR